MQKIIVDESTRAKFHNLAELLEVCDETGRILGHYLPIDRPTGLLDALRTCPHSDEEVERLRQQTGGRPLSEIWKSLENTP